MSDVSEEDRAEAKRLLGDIVSDTLDKTGIAALVKKALPNCNCASRRAKLNRFHERLLDTTPSKD